MSSIAARLSEERLSQYEKDGFLAPIRLLSGPEAAALTATLEDHLHGTPSRSKVPEETTPQPATAIDTAAHPYHLRVLGWRDQKFLQVGDRRVTELAGVASDCGIAGLARQLIGCREVLLMEANPVLKHPGGGEVPWHQDYSYWPLAEPSAVTVWIALDEVGPDNGAMRVIPGSHRWGERLPVSLGDADTGRGGRTGPLGRTFMREDRPDLAEIPQDLRSSDLPVCAYRLSAGECGVHHPLLWHSSSANLSPAARHVLILRYVAAGTVWLGQTRGLYRDVGCADGKPLDGRHFPAVSAAF